MKKRGLFMRFVSNLRPRTIETFETHGFKPSAYLLSTHRMNNRTLQYAHDIRDQGISLFSDNGTKKLIEDIIKEFKEQSKIISKEVSKLKEQLKRNPRSEDVPENLRNDASQLAEDVVTTCEERSEAIDWEELLEQQLSMKPTDLIAQEDFAVACLVSLDLEREITNWSIKKYDERNLRSIRLWERVVNDDRCHGINVYAVLGAVDYDTAYSAGILAAKYGIRNVAHGFVGTMRDPNLIDFYEKHGKIYNIDPPALRRYVRTSEIGQGISDGFKSVNLSLNNFHALGLGAPSLYPVLAAAIDYNTNVSVDATSPIYDAVRDQVFYDAECNADRVSLVKIVRRIVKGEFWAFKCPFCKSFREKYLHKQDAAKDWWIQQETPEIDKNYLKEGEPLANFLPLFTFLPASISSDVHPVRISHNHWAIEECISLIPENPDRKKWCLDKIDEMISYESTGTAKGLKAAKKMLSNNKEIERDALEYQTF